MIFSFDVSSDRLLDIKPETKVEQPSHYRCINHGGVKMLAERLVCSEDRGVLFVIRKVFHSDINIEIFELTSYLCQHIYVCVRIVFLVTPLKGILCLPLNWVVKSNIHLSYLVL